MSNDSRGRDVEALRRAPECHATLEYEQSLRQRPVAGVILILLASATLFGLSIRHQILVQEVYELEVDNYEARLVVAEEKIARLTEFNEKRRQFPPTHAERSLLGEKPALTDEQLDAKAERMRPKRPDEPPIAGWTILYAMVGFVVGIYGLVVLRRG